MGNGFWHDENVPFYSYVYEGHPAVYYVDVILGSLSSIACAIILSVWIYQMISYEGLKSSKSSDESENNNSANSEPKEPSKTKSNSPSPTSKDPSLDSNTMASKSVSTVVKRKKTKKKMHKADKILATIVLVLGSVYAWALTWLSISYGQGKYYYCWTYAIVMQIIYAERIFLYIYYLQRAYRTFRGSHAEIPRTKFCVICFLLFSLWIGAQINTMYQYLDGNCSQHRVMMAIIPLGTVELMLSSFCALLFVSKLRSFMNGDNRVTRAVQEIIAKLTILALVTIMSTFACLSIYPFTFFYAGLFIDTPINLICLLLSFGLNHKYYQILCKPCIGCKDKMKRQKTLENEMKQSVKLHVDTMAEQLSNQTSMSSDVESPQSL